MSANALKRLGTKLGKRQPLTPDEDALYRSFIIDAQERTAATVEKVEWLLSELAPAAPRLGAADVTGRAKTLSTLTDKLERTPFEKLPSVHDVAGVRIVAECSLIEQRLLADAVMHLFTEGMDVSRPALLVDRLQRPSHGYRALHVIGWPAGRPVEVQVRTDLQHVWAQGMEIIGDRWGRGPRYGEPLIETDPSVRATKEETVRTMRQASEVIAAVEETSTPLGILHVDVQNDAITIDPPVLADQIEELQMWRSTYGATIDRAREALLAALNRVTSFVGD